MGAPSDAGVLHLLDLIRHGSVQEPVGHGEMPQCCMGPSVGDPEE
jgi:hypothetical protein